MAAEAPCWNCGIPMPVDAPYCPVCRAEPAEWDTDFADARDNANASVPKVSQMRAAFCQNCGTYVPTDTRHCPKCRELQYSQLQAERLLDSHPLNESVNASSRKRSKRAPHRNRQGESFHYKPPLPNHCPWCGTKLRWGEDKKRLGTWVALNARKVFRSPDPYSTSSRGSSGWSFNILFNRDQIRSGGPYDEHMCSPEIDPLINSEVWKYLVFVEAME